MKHNTATATIALLCSIFIATVTVSAQQRISEDIPRIITYQGFLSTPSGEIAPSGEFPVTFRLYGDAEGSEVIWEGTYDTPIERGLFSAELGSGTFPLPEGSKMSRSLWLGVRIGENPEMSPRTLLSASPYALTIPDGSVTAEKLGTEYVSAITIDGRKVTGRGLPLNITGGEGIALSYDPEGESLRIGLRNDPATEENEKDRRTQAANGSPPVPWSETGNNSTTPGTNYVGTSDAVELEIHVNGGNTSTTSGDRRVMLYDPQTNSPNLIGGFQGNLPAQGSAIEGATIGGGGQSGSVNDVRDDFGTVGGGEGNVAGGLGGAATTDDVYATVAGGQNNQAQANRSTVGGGQSNVASANHATVAGGQNNQAQSNHAAVGGGENNLAQADHATVAGGENNQAQISHAFIGGGQGHRGTDGWTTIGGGLDNQAGDLDLNPLDANYATVGGGWFNTADGYESMVGGGEDNVAGTRRSTIGGGFQNIVFGDMGTIGGGEENSIGLLPAPPATIPPNRPIVTPPSPATSQYATIGGGFQNVVQGQGMWSTIGGGNGNQANNAASTVGGGSGNSALAGNAVVGGGGQNTVNASDGTIGGGNTNLISGGATFAAIGGGRQNRIDGTASAIPGGRYLQLGANSFGFNGDNTTVGPVTTNLSGQNGIAYFGNVNLWIGNVDGTPRELQFYGQNGSFTYGGALYTGFKAPATINHSSGVYTLPGTLPPASPSVSILTGNNGRTLSWTSVLAIANGGTNSTATPTAGGIAFGTGSAYAFTGAGTVGQVLVSNGTGTPTWQTLSSSGWNLTGNGGTNPAVNFVGTTDPIDLVLATNSTQRMRITSAGNVTVNNALTVGNGLTVSSGGASITGTSSIAGSLNLAGVSSPLLVNGSAGTTGQVLVSQGPGNTPIWQTGGGSSSGWSLSGNSASAGDFIGTTNSISFVIKTNNAQRVLVDTDGDVGFALPTSGSGTTAEVSVDINGGLAIRPDDIEAITGNTTITVGDRWYIRISSDAAPSTSRIVSLSDGLQAGQILVLECAGNTSSLYSGGQGFRLRSLDNVKLTGNNNKDFEKWDNITLIWDPTPANDSGNGRWIEISYRDH